MSTPQIKTKEEMINTINTNFTGKAVREGTQTCAYLNSQEQRCAIGCFFPIESFDEDTINELIELDQEAEGLIGTEFAEYLPSKNLDFLTYFQRTHDNMSSVSVKDQKAILVKWLEDHYDHYDHNADEGWI